MAFAYDSSGADDGEGHAEVGDLCFGNCAIPLDFLGNSQIAGPCFWYGESGTASCFWRGVVGEVREADEAGNVENVGEIGVWRWNIFLV